MLLIMEYMKEFLSTPNIPTMQTVHEDERRAIREAELEGRGGQLRRVTSIVVKPPQEGEEMILGNHTHIRTEDFVIHGGNPTVLTAPLENPSDITEHLFPEGGAITIPPETVHTFIFKEAGVLSSTMTGTFEESGTKPHRLI